MYGSPLATVFVPVAAGASILSSILGHDADAYAGNTPAVSTIDNSQTITLLSAGVSGLPKDGKKGVQSEVSGDMKGTIVDDSALMAAVTPRPGAGMGGANMEFSELSPEDISVYVVRKGDSIGQIAEMFGVSTNTILWANDLKKGAPLKEGDTLFILPVSGVQHTVAKSETLASIAKKYKVDADVIVGFNGLETGAVLAIGDELIIPDAEMPNDTAKPSSGKPSSGKKGGTLVDASGYFIHPVPNMKRRSQGLHGPGKRGVDLAAPTGTSIIAAASGTVLLSRDGYNGGYGNMLILQHANGTKTLYAHMSKRVAASGTKVKQGDLIGYVGSTGRSTGPHLHFEVHGAKNPF